MTFEQARIYAAQVRERKQPVCDCPACRQAANLSNVKQLVNNWNHLKAKMRE
ncbi:hypothetical protein [Undibacterium sp.]|jgi:hypothetical protein|uniref:hypothetical protein n=1 Tax=Undibacterium sp. TaxID=1914977 RepID=UPI002C800C2C|nr:hypothetical protein [Undibacterium sp.]HTD03668.1 hypothetical protein [Undibacterium sp.]